MPAVARNVDESADDELTPAERFALVCLTVYEFDKLDDQELAERVAATAHGIENLIAGLPPRDAELLRATLDWWSMIGYVKNELDAYDIRRELTRIRSGGMPWPLFRTHDGTELLQVPSSAGGDQALARLIARRDNWPGGLRRGWLGRLKLTEVAEQGRRKAQNAWRREAEKTFRLARAALEKTPGLTRKQLLWSLMVAIDGKDALVSNGLRRAARDPVYREAYDRARRQLKRGFELAGEPAEFRHLI